MSKDQNKIIILGDSTSMSVGYNNENYSFLIANENIWPKNTTIINPSLHGFGSADSYKFLKDTNKKDLSLVILNIGICDSISTEIPKKKYKHNITRFFNFFPKKKYLINKIPNFEWSNQYNFQLNKSEDIKDINFNINKIINYCFKYKIRICLIIPNSNSYFLPGLAKGNFMFYKYINNHEIVSNILNFEYPNLKQAYVFSEKKQYKESKDQFFKILNDKTKLNYSQEFFSMLANNYAVMCFYNGDIDESLATLEYLLLEKYVRKEIIFYNIAYIYKSKGDNKRFSEYLFKSNEFDNNNFRISSEIRKLLISQKYNFDNYFDVKDVKNNIYFDHCHLDLNGNKNISNFIINKYGRKTGHKANLINHLYNPEFVSNNSNFNSYFNLNSKYSITEIKNSMNNIKTSHNSINTLTSKSNLVHEQINLSLKNFSKHPLFISLDNFDLLNDIYVHYFGKFPELYLFNYSQAIYDFFNSYNYFDSIDINDEIFINKNQRLKIFNNLNLPFNPNYNINNISNSNFNHLNPIINKIKSLLIDNLSEDKLYYNRFKSTMFWFLRESLRYGTQSRFTMVFDFPSLQDAYESTIIAQAINTHYKLNFFNEINDLKSIIEKIYYIHKNEFFNRPFTNDTFFENFNYDEYLLKINSIKKSLT